MAGLHLDKGTVVLHKGKRFSCGSRGPGGSYILMPHRGHGIRHLKPEAAYDALLVGDLSIVQDKDANMDVEMLETHFDGSALSDSEKSLVLKRHFYVDRVGPYLSRGGKLSDSSLNSFSANVQKEYAVHCAAKAIPCIGNKLSAASIRRWFKAWKESGFKMKSLAADSKGNSHIKLSLEQFEFLNQAINGDYLTTNRLTAHSAYMLMVARINIANRARVQSDLVAIKTPSYQTFLNHIKRIDLYEILKERFSAPYAHKVTRAYGITPPTTRHLERVQIDHTQLDVYVDCGTNILVRPWLTIAIDCHSKAILGYWITFDPPSAESVMQVLRSAILPKNMADLGGDPGWFWPMFGIPSELIVDNGKEFHSDDLEMAVSQLAITLTFCPPRTPWYKAQVERRFGEINRSLLAQLPGQVFKYEPKKHGLDYPHLKYEELNKLFLQWMTTILHKTPNKAGSTPEEMWLESVQKNGIPGSELDTKYIMITLSKSENGKALRNDGIDHLNLTYGNDMLKMLRNQLLPNSASNNPKVIIKWSALDIGVIYVLNPLTREYFEVEAKQDHAKGKTLYQHRVILREQRERRKAKMRDDSYTDAHLALHHAVKSLVEQKVIKHKKVGSKVARFLTGQSAVPATRGVAPNLPAVLRAADPIVVPGDDFLCQSPEESEIRNSAASVDDGFDVDPIFLPNDLEINDDSASH